MFFSRAWAAIPATFSLMSFDISYSSFDLITIPLLLVLVTVTSSPLLLRQTPRTSYPQDKLVMLEPQSLQHFY